MNNWHFFFYCPVTTCPLINNTDYTTHFLAFVGSLCDVQDIFDMDLVCYLE